MALELAVTTIPTMGADAGEPRFHRPPRCAVCGDVIGVYERLVHIVGDYARVTSRAIEPARCRDDESCFHLACYPGPADLPLD